MKKTNELATRRLGLFELLGQGLAAVAATRGQHGHGFIDPFQRLQLPVASRMALLSARLAPAPAARRFQSPRGGGPVGGRRLGGVGGILFPPGELALRISDPPVSIRDLLSRLGYSFRQPFDLFPEAFVLPPEIFPSGGGAARQPATAVRVVFLRAASGLPSTHPSTLRHSITRGMSSFFDRGD